MEKIIEPSMLRAEYPRSRHTSWIAFILGALVFIAVLAACIQLFVRYQYMLDNGVVYRIDRITHQVCRVVQGGVNCAPPSRSRSVSTSVSPSLSTSVSGTAGHPARKKT
jgi:hypothetical protein